jgi:hypothetical protein
VSKGTGELQRELAAVVAEYAKALGLGELQAAVRLGEPRIFEKDCVVCGTRLELSCPKCGSLGPQSCGHWDGDGNPVDGDG